MSTLDLADLGCDLAKSYLSTYKYYRRSQVRSQVKAKLKLNLIEVSKLITKVISKLGVLIT